jgi:hypothetical protein
MKKNLNILSIVVTTMVVAGCSPDTEAVDTGRRKAATNEPGTDNTGDANGSQTIVDYKSKCGVDPKDDENKIIFEQTLRSLPIVVTGVQMGAAFKVTTTATLHIASTVGGGNQNVSVTVDDVQVNAGNFLMNAIAKGIAKKKAQTSAEKASGAKKTETLPFGQWMNVVAQNPQEFGGLFCGVSATKKITDDTDGHGEVEFAPALPSTINPRADEAALKQEIGQGRVFHISANVLSPKPGWQPGTSQGTVTITPVPAQFKMTDGTTYASDIGFSVVVDFPMADGQKSKPSFATKQMFLINTKTHEFEAIVDQTQQVTADGTAVPTKVLLKTN